MHAVERQDAAPLRLDPIERVVFGALRHWEDAAGIGLEQHLRRDLDHDVVDGGHGFTRDGSVQALRQIILQPMDIILSIGDVRLRDQSLE